MKYELTENTKEINGTRLYQIQALKDFGDVKNGDLGGWIEKESNLSQAGLCWVSGDARVFRNARVFGKARVYGKAQVFGDAEVYGKAQVFGDAEVSGDARVSDDAWVYGKSLVYGDARVFGKARVYDDARVFGKAQVFGDAEVSGDARVSENARVFGDAWVYGDARVFQNMHIKFGNITTDLSADLISNIEAQTGLPTVSGKVYCYKHVREDLPSLHDEKFQYKVGEWIEADSPDLSDKSCATGLHVSNAQYWNGRDSKVRLFCKVELEDIITVQEGKIRCKKLFVIDTCDGLVY